MSPMCQAISSIQEIFNPCRFWIIDHRFVVNR
jgi:hypothetical protein